jgi:2-polyprenyl-6-methoxyphenol hydroxylase-like FAD-dependent oxidoreductase
MSKRGIEMADVIVVGARCAGSPTAMLLARKGYDVLLVDRASFPSDTLSTHYIHQPGVACLARWGLLDRVAASGCPPVRTQRFDVGPFALVGQPPPADGITAAYAPRRTVLDSILVAAAAEAGAEVRQGFAVSELVFDGDRVVGVRSSSGVTERAQIVIGADGRNSLVARSVDAPVTDRRPPRTCAYYTYWSGLEQDGVELYLRPGRMIGAGPTNDGQSLVIVYWPAGDFARVRAGVEGEFTAAAELVPSFAERLRAGEQTERFRGTADLPFFLRRPHGPGWALVGDAGYHKDPITAEGIADAFRDAELLAAAIDDGLAGRRPLDEALAGYEQARDEAVRPMYELTYEFAGLAPPSPEQQQLFGALRGDQDATNRFIGTIAGTTPIPEFFAPESLARIVGAAAVA